jgi:D-alanyl-D-alanine carboxypeptidase
MLLKRERHGPVSGRNLGDGKFMFRATAASSRGRRLFVLGLITAVSAIVFTTDFAEAKRKRGKRIHHARVAAYAPPFSTIIVDANSGAVLQANNPDAQRFPASLTKIMTLYVLFESSSPAR